MEVTESPCVLAGKRIKISTNAVDSDIYYLSKNSMKRLKLKWDLENYVAEMCGVP